MHWATKKVVVRDFYVSFKPMGADPDADWVDLSEPVIGQACDEAVYVALSGRPAGLLNFIREHIGLARRFEFVMSSSQCIQRIGSPSTQILSASTLDGLNTITVGLLRPLVRAILLALLSLSLLAAIAYPAIQSAFEDETSSLNQNGQDIESAQQDPFKSFDENGYDDYSSESDEISDIGAVKSPSIIGVILGLFNMFLTSFAPSWVWVLVGIALGLYAAYLLFIAKINLVTVSEAGNEVVAFIVSPSFLESRGTDIPLEDLNRLPLIFRVLKTQ